MALARLLLVTLMLCSVSASAQQSRFDAPLPDKLAGQLDLSHADFVGNTIAKTEPWRLIPEPLVGTARSENSALDRLRISDYHAPQFNQVVRPDVLRPNADPTLLPPVLKSQQDADTTCLSMRSYVVARDSKDSDSTHPAGYSTCQPTSRYRLKSTEIRVESQDR